MCPFSVLLDFYSLTVLMLLFLMLLLLLVLMLVLVSVYVQLLLPVAGLLVFVLLAQFVNIAQKC